MCLRFMCNKYGDIDHHDRMQTYHTAHTHTQLATTQCKSHKHSTDYPTHHMSQSEWQVPQHKYSTDYHHIHSTATYTVYIVHLTTTHTYTHHVHRTLQVINHHHTQPPLHCASCKACSFQYVCTLVNAWLVEEKHPPVQVACSGGLQHGCNSCVHISKMC